MQCPKASELMSLHLDNLLDSEGAEALASHLDSCPACSEEWEVLERLSRLLQSAPLSVPALGFSARVGRRLAQRQAQHQQRRGAFLLLGGLALLLLLSLPSLVGMGLLIGDLSSPALISTLINALVRSFSVLRAVGDALTLVFSALLSTPAAILAPSYVVLALAAIYAWARLAFRPRMAPAEN